MSVLIPKKETLTIEFESDANILSDEAIIDSVVAFANTEGGAFYLGVEDDGTVTGIHPKHEDFRRLAVFIANNTVPPIATIIEEIQAEYPVIKISVPKSRQIVSSSSGKILRRKLKADNTPENVPMYPYELNSRLSDLSMLDFSSQPVPESCYEDLDIIERARLRNIISKYSCEKQLLDFSDEELDKALQLVTEINGKLIPTYSGLLLIGKENRIKKLIPTAEVILQSFEGSSIKMNISFCYPLLKSIETAFNFINLQNPEYEMDDGLFRISIPDFNRRAIREAIANAFSHRDYTRLGAIRITIDDDGLTVSNPGGFIDGITLDNLLTVEPHGRNPVLSSILKRIGVAERCGRGIQHIFEGSSNCGKLLPDYSESTSDTTKLFIPRSVPDEEFIRMIIEEQKNTSKINC